MASEVSGNSLLRRFTAILDDRLRTRRVLEWLSTCDPQEACALLELLHRGMRVPERRVVYCDLLRLAADQQVHVERCREIYNECAAIGLVPMVRMFLPVAPFRAATAGQMDPTNPVESLPLGTRKAKARLRDKDLLDRLARDNNPDVLEILLDNPRTTEKDVLFLASRRPANDQWLTRIFTRQKWLGRPAIQEALARNPYGPTHLAAAVVPLLHPVLQREISTDTNIHPVVRESAHLLRTRLPKLKCPACDQEPQT
jgi:hypothetical protein